MADLIDFVNRKCLLHMCKHGKVVSNKVCICGVSGVTFCCWNFFLHSKACNSNIAIIANIVCMWKTQMSALRTVRPLAWILEIQCCWIRKWGEIRSCYTHICHRAKINMFLFFKNKIRLDSKTQPQKLKTNTNFGLNTLCVNKLLFTDSRFHYPWSICLIQLITRIYLISKPK